MKKLILESFLAPGDIVMLTAAVRDLHKCYPKQFATDMRTSCPELWDNNPYLTPLSEKEPGVEKIKCSYPLINRSNQAPYHCLHGYMHFLNERLGLCIQPTAFKGDIHLSRREKWWYSQVHEVTRKAIPFWIVAAGGKYDISIKWWETQRYQQVIDHFRGKIQFVQVGQEGHHHPRLQGVIDLRGQTTLRELVRLIYHSQGVLCPITSLMHLAAAVECKDGLLSRPCVVVAGGREPAHWEAYPNHQYIHTNGSLSCCANGGCWRDRVRLMGDGTERDGTNALCVQVTDGLPRCMDMITSAEVIRRIELYFNGGTVTYLSAAQAKAGRRGVRATRSNTFDDQPLNIHNARGAFEKFVQTLPAYPGKFEGQGIVICGGGLQYFTNAWVCINVLRELGCTLPIQLWYLGEDEMDEEMKLLLKPFGIECVDAMKVRKRHPARRLGGWELKPYAMLHCPFREVLLLDADNVPVVNPEFLFQTQPYRQTGAIFWPDYGQFKKTQMIWDNCDLMRPNGPEFESGQIVLDKKRCWQALCLTMWFNENSDFYYEHLLGDKETFHLAFEKLKKSYTMPSRPIHSLEGTMCQHDFEGNRLFQHRNGDKWNLFLRNKAVKGFSFEEECRGYVNQLREVWDGRMSRYGAAAGQKTARTNVALEQVPRVEACMISCQERVKVRERTLRNLAATDWGDRPVHVQLDTGQSENRQERQALVSYLALRHGVESKADYILFLEDDLVFNRWLWHNLCHWAPVQERRITLAGLYNPNIRALAWAVRTNSTVMDPDYIYGSQAFLLSLSAARHIVRHWRKIDGMQDIRISRLAAQLKQPIFYHTPSLVQHVGVKSVWGGTFHRARDYDPDWKAANPDL